MPQPATAIGCKVSLIACVTERSSLVFSNLSSMSRSQVEQSGRLALLVSSREKVTFRLEV